MYTDIIFIVSLFLELVVLSFFIRYTLKYFRQYHESIDPYTKATLLLLSLSMVVQLCRLPIVIMRMAYNSQGGNTVPYDEMTDYSKWYTHHYDHIMNVLYVIVFVHANLQKVAIIINILRWQILVIKLYNNNVPRNLVFSNMFSLLFAATIIVSSYIRIKKPFEDAFLNYIIGDFINGYVVNLLIVFCYIYIYFKLKHHYTLVQF
jgi:hypothetical protein